MSALRVGLLGCGPWGRLILRDLLAAGAEVAVWSRSTSSRAAAASGGATSVHATVDEMPEVDGFVIATATSAHVDSIESVVARGVPLFVEKPLCTDPAEADRLARLYGDRLFVMDKWRYHHGVLALAELARSGSLGAVRGLHTTRIGYSSSHPDTDAAWVLTPHDLSIGLEILGRIPALRSAVGTVDEAGNVHTMAATFSDPAEPWLTSQVSYRSPVERREVLLVGSEGQALLGGGYAETIEIRRGSSVVPQPFITNMPLADELNVFLGHLRGGPAPRSSAAEAAAIVRAVAAARQLLLAGS